MDRKNIVLDFMDPENKILYGCYDNLTENEHIRLMKEGLNLAVFLCKEYCIIPPCAFLQCKYTRKALEQSHFFLEEGLIRFPVREQSLSKFIEKKRRNYEKDKNDENYAEFFASSGPDFLKKYASAIIKRGTRVGNAVAEMVAATSFDEPLWKNLKEWYAPDQLLEIQAAPKKLIEAGEAISVKAIKRILEFECNEDAEFEIGQILQNKYFYIYIYEYDARLIHGLPIKTTDFMIEHFGAIYEYEFWRYILRSLGLLNCITKSGSKAVCMIRNIPNCYDFVSSVMSFGQYCKTVEQAKRKFPKVLKILKETDSYDSKKIIQEYSDDQQVGSDIQKYLTDIFDKVSNAIEIFFERNPIKKKGIALIDKEIVSSTTIGKGKEKYWIESCDCDKPYLFVSFSRESMEREVYQDCILLGKMGVNYWIDEANIIGATKQADGWHGPIEKALKECSVFIPYISPEYFESKACLEEVKSFLKENDKAGIVLLLKKGFTIDQAIQKIESYDNLIEIEREKVESMIELFKVRGNKDVLQLYRSCKECFKHYIEEAIFFNTFKQYRVITKKEFSNYQEWNSLGEQLLEEIKFEE